MAFFIQWWLLKEPSSVYQRNFFQAIKFRLAPTTKHLQPDTATRIFLPCAIKYHKISKVNGQLFRCFLLSSWQIRQLSYQAPVLREVFRLLRVSRHIYTSGIPGELSVYPHTMSRWGSGPDSPQHLKLSCAKALLRLSFQCRRICEGFQLYGIFRSDNFEKSDRKSILS